MYNWLDRMEKEERPFLVALVANPLESLDSFGEGIVTWVKKNWKLIVIFAATLIGIKLAVTVIPADIFNGVLQFIIFSHTAFSRLTGSLSLSMVAVILVVYWLNVVVLWTPQLSTPFMIANHCVWVVTLGFFCSYLGAFQIPAFIVLVTYCFAGFLYSVRSVEDGNFLSKCKAVIAAPKRDQPGSYAKSSQIGDETGSNPGFERPDELDLSSGDYGHGSESDQYFKILFYACGAVVLWKHTWLLFLGLICISVYGIRLGMRAIGLSPYLKEQFQIGRNGITSYINERREVLFPICLPGVLKLNSTTYKFMCSKAKSYVDDLSSVIVILLLVFFIIFISVFSFVQIYSETIAVAQLGGNLINRTLTYRPDLIDMLPIELQNFDDMIDNAHRYGRTTIAEYVDHFFNETDSTQSEKLKNQILTLWDRLIQSYLDKSGTLGPRVNSESIYDSLGEIVTNPSAKAGVIEWAKANLGMLMEVGDSVWLIVKTNITVLLSMVGTCFSIVLGGGQAVLKFLFHSIIFFTCLYYLLQSSRDRYAPVATNINSQWGSRITKAIEDSISSVLIATLKLSLFHTLFTWLTHTVFGAHIVYLPSVLAALLAAAPFLETYWCSLPAFLDLWLSQDKFWLACLLFLIHFIVPSNFNPIIHSEIKGGGHPYLTGLSIAGGMYLLGLEGAVLGPLLLCLLVVLFDITKSALKDSPRTPQPTR